MCTLDANGNTDENCNDSMSSGCSRTLPDDSTKYDIKSICIKINLFICG